MHRCRSERGDVIASGLLKLVAGLLMLGVVLFDTGAVIVNHVQLDEVAWATATHGARTWTAQRSTAAVHTAVQQRLARHASMTLEDVVVAEDRVAVTLSRPANVLLLSRLGPLSAYARGRATATSDGPRHRDL